MGAAQSMSIGILRSDPAWTAVRVGYATASKANAIRGRLKNGTPNAENLEYRDQVVYERRVGRKSDGAGFTTKWMQRGIELQDPAIQEFEMRSGIIVGPEMFITHPEIEYAGATYDGSIDDDGTLEVKVPMPETHERWLAAGIVPAAHRNQMLMQLAVTRRKYGYFVSYDPDRNEAERLFVRKLVPEAGEIEALEADVRFFLECVEAEFDRRIDVEAFQL